MPPKLTSSLKTAGEWKVLIRGFVLTVELSDEGVFFAGTEPHRAIVVFFGDARVTVIKKSAGKVRMITAVDGGRRCAGGPEQMGGHVCVPRTSSALNS
jgi:hypothetical protein